MISIKVNGGFLELFPDTKINLKLVNPIFADGNVIPGSYSIPFDIPMGKASEHNSVLFGHIDVIENTYLNKKFDAELFFDKVFYKKGKLEISSATDTTITTNFVFGFQTLEDSIKDVSLSTVLSETITLFDPSSFVRQVDLKFDEPNRTYEITINGEIYSQDVVAVDTRATYETLAAAINANTENNNCVASAPSEITPPILTLKPATNPTDLNSEFKIQVDVLAFWEVSTNYNTYFSLVSAAIEPYFTDDKPDDKIRFPMFRNLGAYDEDIHVNNHVNSNINESLITNIPALNVDSRLYRYMNYTSLCPILMLKYVFNKIESYFNVTFSGDFLDENWYNNGLLFATGNIDILADFFNDIPIIFFKNEINLSDFVPDIKVNDFLKELQKRFNITTYLDEKNEVKVTQRKNIINSTEYIDLTTISSTPVISSFPFQNGLLLKYVNNTDDKEAVADEIQVGSEINSEITTSVGGVYSESSTYNNQQSIKEFFTLPTVDESPTSKYLRVVFETEDKLTDSENNSFHTFINEPPKDITLIQFMIVNGQIILNFYSIENKQAPLSTSRSATYSISIGKRNTA